MEDLISKKKNELNRSRRKERLFALLLISPYCIIFMLFTLIPVICGVVFSFMKYNPYAPGEAEFVGFKNFINIFDFSLPVSKTFWESFSTMLVFDIVAVPCLIVIPLTLAYFLNMNPPGYKIFRAIIYLPSIVSITIVGIIFGNMFAGNSSGLINAWLGTDIKWLSGKPWEGDILRWLVILIASVWWQSGANFVIFSGALRNVPKSLYEACEMDGGGRFRKIVAITLPNIKSSVAICLFNTLIGYLGLYGQPYVLNEIENQSILVSPMMFIQKYLGNLSYAKLTGYICAAAIVFGLIVMAFSVVERVIMSERPRKGKRLASYTVYQHNKNLLNETADENNSPKSEEINDI